ncbi:hypothetical protein OUZ56_026191 [Daphnia magna]|uniref:Uncharacterized protein n=1 Tax=Daphnia magna TaxID=35525 RepID=A0ABQ9ZL76_9CRUS|nr:hypothetical protein OUZ56_026191 [Daphnia magna]
MNSDLNWQLPCGQQEQNVTLVTAVKHPALRVFHKCKNLICVEVGLLRLQRLMDKMPRCVGILLITRKEDEEKLVNAKPPDTRDSVTSYEKFKACSSVSKE